VGGNPQHVEGPSGFRLFLPDDGSGVSYHDKWDGDRLTIVGQQDVGAIIEANRQEFNQEVKGRLAARGRWGVRYARVPLLMLEKWARDAHLDPRDPDFQQKLDDVTARNLEDPDYREFKTANFRA